MPKKNVHVMKILWYSDFKVIKCMNDNNASIQSLFLSLQWIELNFSFHKSTDVFCSELGKRIQFLIKKCPRYLWKFFDIVIVELVVITMPTYLKSLKSALLSIAWDTITQSFGAGAGLFGWSRNQKITKFQLRLHYKGRRKK